MTLHYQDDSVTLYHGNCVTVLGADELGYDWSLGYGTSRLIPDSSVDAVITDPPYGISFMGKQWDQPGKFGSQRRSPGANHRRGHKDAALNAGLYDLSPVALAKFQRWCTTWASECLRVLKPGGHLLSFGGSRTWHRLAVGVEDAGFELRDSMAWLYGSGFPKSMDVSKAIDKAAGAEREVVGERRGGAVLTMGGDNPRPWHERQAERGGTYDVTAPATEAAQQWAGWGTALKPSFEPIVVARKPLVGTVAANVLAYGTGALNIDACRIAHRDAADLAESQAKNRHADFGTGARENNVYGTDSRTRESQGNYDGTAGRWPANVLLDEHQAAELDQQSGTSVSRIGAPRGAAAGEGWGMTKTGTEYADSGGASRFFPVFRYEAKAPTSERPNENGVQHPTVKPLDLMRWLVRLVTPVGAVVLEPFAGSGTTAEACVLEDRRCIAIEREAEYLPLIVSRLRKPVQAGLFGIEEGA